MSAGYGYTGDGTPAGQFPLDAPEPRVVLDPATEHVIRLIARQEAHRALHHAFAPGGIEPIRDQLQGLPHRILTNLQGSGTPVVDGRNPVRVGFHSRLERGPGCSLLDGCAGTDGGEVLRNTHESSVHVAGPVLMTPDVPATIMDGTTDTPVPRVGASGEARRLVSPLTLPTWTFGDRLRKARRTRGLEQTHLAERLGVTAAAIAQWETNVTHPRDVVATARLVERFCRVPAWWLLGLDIPKDSAPSPPWCRRGRAVPQQRARNLHHGRRVNAVVELQQPRVLIPRVAGHDLRVLVDHPYVYLRRDDVEALAAIPPWSTGEALLLEPDQVVDVEGMEFYPLEVAIARASDSTDPDKALAFLTWVDTELFRLTAPESLELAHRSVPFIESHTVRQAARLLDLGRQTLFDHMAGLGWIERNTPADEWVVTHRAHSRDWLTLRAVKVGPVTRAGQRDYLQIYVTPAGLDELRRALARPAPIIAPSPALFD